jgi:nucleotide-binding universal stress UspA family protein
MKSESHPYTVVVGVDYSESSDLVLEAALDAAADKPGAVVHVLHVLPAPQTFLTPDIVTTPDGKVSVAGECAEELKQYVTRIVAKRALEQRGGPASVVTHVIADKPAEQVAQLAADVEADLVVVGTHGRRGVPRLLLGSVAEMTIRLAPCPVLVVRRKTAPEPVPTIEPPCPRCVETRRATEGREFWCEQHREHHGRRHTYHQTDRVSADGNLPLVFHR